LAQSVDVWHDPRWARRAGWTAIVLAALLYGLTLDSGLRPDELQGGDLITHQYAQVQARPGNAPGYPLYTMGGWLWFRLTGPLFGWALNPVQRLSSYSALWAVLALAVLYRLILLATRGNWPLAALSTLFYAVTYFFWYYSVTTEQYTSVIFQTLLMGWLAFRWDEQAAAGQPEKADASLLWLALAAGSCLANLATALFILPPLIGFILNRQPEILRRPGMLARLAGLGLLPAASYAYIYLRGAAHPEWWGQGQWPSAWAWFADFMTTHQGRDELAPGLTLSRFFTGEYPALVWGELTWVVLVGGLAGLWALGRRRAGLIGGTLAIYFIFCWIDRFGNWYQVIMPAYPLLVLGLAAGSNALWNRRPQLPYLMLAGLVILVGYRFALSLPRANQSWRPEDTALEPGWAILSDRPQPDSVVVADYPEWLALGYLCQVWGASPPIYAQPVCQPEPRQPARPVTGLYLTRRAALADPGCLAERHHYAAGANLIQLEIAPNQELPASARPAARDFGLPLTLAGFEVRRAADPQPAGAGSQPGWQLSLYWRANATMPVNYTISVRPLQHGAAILDAGGQPILQDQQPVWNTYPTSRWTPGEIVRDDYGLLLPAQAAPDGIRVLVYQVVPDGVQGQHFVNLGEAVVTFQP
jgi:hypothetical protein